MAYADEIQAIDGPRDMVQPLAEEKSNYIRAKLYNENGTLVAQGLEYIQYIGTNGTTNQYKLVIELVSNDLLSAGESFDLSFLVDLDGYNGISTNWAFRSVTSDWYTDVLWTSQEHTADMIKDHKWLGGKVAQEKYTIKGFTTNSPTKYFWLEQEFGIYPGDTFYLDVLGIEYSLVTQSSSGKLSSIIDYIKNLPSNIKNSLASLFDGIKNAVVNLGQTILDGIKSLFIPDEKDMIEYGDMWDSLLADRFGALYECGSILVNLFSDFRTDGRMMTQIDFPAVVVPLPGGESWRFGGFKVDVVPKNGGIEIFLTVLKAIGNITATLAFIVAMYNKYERVIRE